MVDNRQQLMQNIQKNNQTLVSNNDHPSSSGRQAWTKLSNSGGGVGGNIGGGGSGSRVNKFGQTKNSNNKFGFYQNNQNKARCRESKSFQRSIRESVQAQKHFESRNRHFPIDFDHSSFRTKNKLHDGSMKKTVGGFVQANCQFVVNVNGHDDYKKYLHDPDLPVFWDHIEEILFSSSCSICCPICLDVPTAAKITRCGHIFCWSCILHYLALSDKETRSCPICFDNIHKFNLKSVRLMTKIEYKPEDRLSFVLMKIQKNTTLALPANYQGTSERSLRNFEQDIVLDTFSKVFISSPHHLDGLIKREQQELVNQMNEYRAENMPEICFVENALKELNNRQNSITSFDEMMLECLNLNLNNTEDSEGNDDYCYFYQSEDGQQIYLNPINIRMLKHEYGDLRHGPQTLSGKVVELHRLTITNETRKRYAYLRHLPLGCEFSIAELAFNDESPPIVSKETLCTFENEIKNRNRQRLRKEKQQKIRDRNIEIENNRKYFGITPLPNFRLDNRSDFPDYHHNNDDDDANVLQITDDNFPVALSSSLEATGANFPPPQSIDEQQPGSSFQSSFANMLGKGGKFDEKLRQKKPTDTKRHYQPNQDDNNTDDELFLQPEMNLTLSDFLGDCVKFSDHQHHRTKNNKKKNKPQKGEAKNKK